MTVQNGWDAVDQFKETLADRYRKYRTQTDDLDDFQVFDQGRLAGRTFVAKNATEYAAYLARNRVEYPVDPDGDGWDALRYFQRFVRENYLAPTRPSEIPDFKPGEKGNALGRTEEAQEIIDDVQRVLETEGPDADPDALLNENVDDPDADPVITPDGEVVDLGRRDPGEANTNVIDSEVTDMDDNDTTDEPTDDQLHGVDPDDDSEATARLSESDREDLGAEIADALGTDDADGGAGGSDE